MSETQLDGRFIDSFGLTAAKAEEFLASSVANDEFKVLGQITNSSNTTLLVEFAEPNPTAEQQNYKAVYKPIDAERPLHDFPPNLARREVAAYQLCQILGWGLIPPTVMAPGPLGLGSYQLFVEADFAEHYLSLVRLPQFETELKKICAFDYIANNTDRKSSHCLMHDKSQQIWAIDQGLCFHEQYKLRTVIWEFAGESIAGGIVDDISKVIDNWSDVRSSLIDSELLTPMELDALRTRSNALVSSASFPEDETGGMRYPWPVL